MSMIGNLLRVTENELKNYINDSSLLEDRIYADEVSNLLDIDKTWDGILYILTGYTIENIDKAKPPLKWVIFGDNIIDGEQDLGYGPANFCTPQEVVDVNIALSAISSVEFRTKFDSLDLAGEKDAYPGIVWPNREEAFEYYLEYFLQIKEFYLLAAENGQAVITFIN
jgi:hypothetical protein